MRNFKYIWVIGLIVTALIIAVPIMMVASEEPQPIADPWAGVPERVPPTDHSVLLTGPYTTGQEVTRACLECHAEAGEQMLDSAHFKWVGEPVSVNGSAELMEIGKKNLLNNFCLGVQSNWTGCTRCHAGYGWKDASYDFTQQENVDCLICHDQSGQYAKGAMGLPADGVDLVAAAQSVSTPTRLNCGGCHFNGGGGDAVKHGDLDETLYYPAADQDVHMGANDFLCVDCHQTEDHQISGRAMSVSVDNANQVACTDCHSTNLHSDTRITEHLDTVACQTCHVPEFATRQATKVSWDWSTAGQDLPEDAHTYLKIKGSFVYEQNVQPEYAWFNGTVGRYLLGMTIDPTQVTAINPLNGSITDPTAKIFPFKVHYAKQPYDAKFNYLLQPQTVGATGYWTTFDWISSLENGSKATGIPFSGEYGFAETLMYWPQTHMVQPSEAALQCADCHGEAGRLDWIALGYYGDPMTWGGRTLPLDATQVADK